ncbi:MAG: hypothetical protein QOD75_4023 [Blastocatellia bacterium]|jgi:hypothetical protein|nr:hypothetical protein [Blastocatellia bacterium]
MGESQSNPRLQLSIEGVVAIIIGILLVITPMNALTRSGFLLIVLLLAAHLAWRSIGRPYLRYLSIGGMAIAYLLVVTLLFVTERSALTHPTAANSVITASTTPIPTPTPTPTPTPVSGPSPAPSPAALRRQKKSAPKSVRCSAVDRLLGRC